MFLGSIEIARWYGECLTHGSSNWKLHITNLKSFCMSEKHRWALLIPPPPLHPPSPLPPQPYFLSHPPLLLPLHPPSPLPLQPNFFLLLLLLLFLPFLSIYSHHLLCICLSFRLHLFCLVHHTHQASSFSTPLPFSYNLQQFLT